MNRFSLLAAACVAAAIVLYFVVIGLPEESHNAWGTVAIVALLAVIFAGIASALVARRHR